MQATAAKSGGVHEGDIVLCLVGDDDEFATEALEWLVDQGMKLLGVSSGGVELPDPDTATATTSSCSAPACR